MKCNRKLWFLAIIALSVVLATAATGSAQTAPILKYPESGENLNDNTPTFCWDNTSVADNYELWVDNDSDFSSPEIRDNTTGNWYNPNVKLPAGLLDNTYYWKVRAYKDNNPVSDFSSTRSFSIDTTAPAVISPPGAEGETGFPFMLVFGAGAVFFIGGIVVGCKLLRGRGEGIVERVGPKSRVGDDQARDAMDKADDEARRAGDVLKEASKQDVDVSAEQEMLKKAQEFDDAARKEYRDGRYDSAFAYAGATSALGSGIASALEARMVEARGAADAKRKAEADIRAAEGAIKEVRSKMGEAESTGIDVKSSTSLTDLASEIMKAAGAAKDPETYRFQSTTAKRIAEHAAASLKGSIEGQKDQVKRTADAFAGAKDALGKAEAMIEKQRKEFDTLVAEYWLGVANEVYSIAEDKKLNAEVREAMADTSTKICEWIDDMFERRDIRARMKKGKGITLR